MSFHARDGANANSAICVSVSPEDFGNKPLDGVAFARQIEQRAFAAGGNVNSGRNVNSSGNGSSSGDSSSGDNNNSGGNSTYNAPACTVEGFLTGKPTLSGAAVTPTYTLGVREADFNKIFPAFVTETLKAGLSDFARKLRAFGDGGAVLTAPETRTSSPVRIMRNENLISKSIAGLYPCGEGAGFAGGIVSAAADGLRCAQAAANNNR
jgi:uncharacterized FAD-dependent dehydrogenase